MKTLLFVLVYFMVSSSPGLEALKCYHETSCGTDSNDGDCSRSSRREVTCDPDNDVCATIVRNNGAWISRKCFLMSECDALIARFVNCYSCSSDLCNDDHAPISPPKSSGQSNQPKPQDESFHGGEYNIFRFGASKASFFKVRREILAGLFFLLFVFVA